MLEIVVGDLRQGHSPFWIDYNNLIPTPPPAHLRSSDSPARPIGQARRELERMFPNLRGTGYIVAG
ncbi:MAG: hypothetical protein ABI743_10960, partial [bacterium]